MKTENSPSNPNAFAYGYGTDNCDIAQEGMTIRDYFANSAMNGIVSENPTKTIDYIARRSFEIADAMIKQREL